MEFRKSQTWGAAPGNQGNELGESQLILNILSICLFSRLWADNLRIFVEYYSN